jgi:cell division protein FtsZ
LDGIVRVSVVATGIDNLIPARQAQPAESSLTELAGRLRNDSRRIADRIERSAPLPQSDSPPLRPSARQPEGHGAKPISEYACQGAPQGLDPYGRSSPVRNSIEENVLDTPAFLRRKAN